MKIFFKKTTIFLLKWLAKIYLWRIKPEIIVVAGTIGRHWIKEAMENLLTEKGLFVRVSKKNFNAEIGLPLSVLGLDSGKDNFQRWLSVLASGFGRAFYPKSAKLKLKEPKYQILEMAIDRPQDMNYLLSIVKPLVAILTSITMIYQENFECLDQISREFEKLARSLPKNGLLALNFDDERLKTFTRFGKTIGCQTIGFAVKNKQADYFVENIRKDNFGQTFTIVSSLDKNAPKSNNFRLDRFGEHHICAALVKEIIKNHFLR